MKTKVRGARPFARRSGVVGILAGLSLWTLAGKARSDDYPNTTEVAVAHDPLDGAKEIDRAARFFLSADQQGNAKTCFDGWEGKLAALPAGSGSALESAKKKYEAAQQKATADARSAADALEQKKQERQSRDEAVRGAEATLGKAAVRKKNADEAVTAAGRSAPLLQKAADELTAATKDLDEASIALTTAKQKQTEAVRQEGVARKALDDEQAKGRSAVIAAATERAKAIESVRTALVKLTARAPGGFESFLTDATRVKACAALRDGYVTFDAGTATTTQIAKVTKEEQAKDELDSRGAAETARAQDLLRKASPLSSVLGTGNGFVELGGAPDRAIFTIMGALGADQKTTGTQVVMTLGLSTLFGLSDEKRLRLEAPLRNLFLRTGLPLSVTEPAPLVGDGAPSTADAETAVSRMSFVLGTSLLDNSDPRLFGTNRDCYRLVPAYHWNAVSLAADQELQRERARSFDVCNRRAAERQRLAIRGGLGLLTENGDTHVETLGAVLVWAPSSMVYFNGLYQRLFLPEPRHSFGGGFSVAGNVGGDAPAGSGVDGWARLGLDVLVLGVLDDATKDVDTEVRIQATVKAKLSNNVLSFGIGPRLVGSALSDPGVLATIALSYDADALIDPLLQPAPAPAAKAP